MQSPASNRRVKGTSIERPIVYGSTAEWLGRKATEGRTHQWTVYVRGLGGEDISFFVKKVSFRLHPSFENPVRTIEKAPFELTEFGWGEFLIGITLYFNDTNEKPLEFPYFLKLFNGPVTENNPLTRKPVVREVVDEIIFVDPSEAFLAKLSAHLPKGTAKAYKQAEEKEVVQLNSAQKYVKEEIQRQVKKYEDIEAELKAKLAELEAVHNEVCGLENVPSHIRESSLKMTSVIKDDDSVDTSEVVIPKKGSRLSDLLASSPTQSKGLEQNQSIISESSSIFPKTGRRGRPREDKSGNNQAKTPRKDLSVGRKRKEKDTPEPQGKSLKLDDTIFVSPEIKNEQTADETPRHETSTKPMSDSPIVCIGNNKLRISLKLIRKHLDMKESVNSTPARPTSEDMQTTLNGGNQPGKVKESAKSENDTQMNKTPVFDVQPLTIKKLKIKGEQTKERFNTTTQQDKEAISPGSKSHDSLKEGIDSLRKMTVDVSAINGIAQRNEQPGSASDVSALPFQKASDHPPEKTDSPIKGLHLSQLQPPLLNIETKSLLYHPSKDKSPLTSSIDRKYPPESKNMTNSGSNHINIVNESISVSRETHEPEEPKSTTNLERLSGAITNETVHTSNQPGPSSTPTAESGLHLSALYLLGLSNPSHHRASPPSSANPSSPPSKNHNHTTVNNDFTKSKGDEASE